MSDLHRPSQRKRLRTEGPLETVQPPRKRLKSASETIQFWDTLSKIWLTRPALDELDRRNRVAGSRRHRLLPQHRRPLTRLHLAKLRERTQSQSTPASDYLRSCNSAELSSIQKFAKHGGPDLLDARGYPGPVLRSRETMSSSLSGRRHRRRGRGSEPSEPSSATPYTSSGITKTSRSTGAYDPNFEQRMVDDGIYPDGYEYPDGRVPPLPQNWKHMQQMLTERRPSLSPSVFPEERYKEFKRADAQVTSENRATRKVIPMIQGAIRDERCVDGDIPFNNLADMMRGRSHKAKPDVYYGARPEQLDRQVRDNLSTHIVPSTTDTRPMAPNFFVEAKRPAGSAAVALNQAAFVGAAGARGMHSLQTYGQQVPTYDNNAYTISSTYHSGQLKMYAHHPGQPDGPGTKPAYYMNQLNAYAMTGNRDSLVQGITAFRNAETWTAAQRNALVERANYAANGYDGNEDEDEDEDNQDDDEDDEEYDAIQYAAPADPILSSFTSQSPFSTSQSISHKGKAIRQESDTSADELAPDYAHSKRHSKGKHTRHSSRTTRRTKQPTKQSSSQEHSKRWGLERGGLSIL